MYSMMHDQLQQQLSRVLERFALLPYPILQFDGIVKFESNRSDSVVVSLPANHESIVERYIFATTTMTMNHEYGSREYTESMLRMEVSTIASTL